MKIAFVGKAGSGKTTLARALVKNFGFARLCFAKPLKEVFQHIVFWRPLNKSVDRRFLQILGDGARSLVAKDVWIRWFEFALREHEEAGVENLVVDDCRYLNEVQFLRDNGFVIVRLFGRGYGFKGELGEHPSETELDDWTADYQVDSSGSVEQAWRQLVDLMRKMEGGAELASMYA